MVSTLITYCRFSIHFTILPLSASVSAASAASSTSVHFARLSSSALDLKLAHVVAAEIFTGCARVVALMPAEHQHAYCAQFVAMLDSVRT